MSSDQDINIEEKDINKLIQNLLVSAEWLKPKKIIHNDNNTKDKIIDLTLYIKSIILHEISQQDLSNLIHDINYLIENKKTLYNLTDILKLNTPINNTVDLLPKQLKGFNNLQENHLSSIVNRLINFNRYGVGKGELFLTMFTEANRLRTRTNNKRGDVITPEGKVIEVKFTGGRIGRSIPMNLIEDSDRSSQSLAKKYAPFLSEYAKDFDYLMLFSSTGKKVAIYNTKDDSEEFLKSSFLKIQPVADCSRPGTFKLHFKSE
jgi:hypothetical protein